MRPRRPRGALASAILAVAVAGCFSHRIQTEPIEIKPIHVTVDVNVKVQRELDKFFDFESTEDAASLPNREGKE